MQNDLGTLTPSMERELRALCCDDDLGGQRFIPEATLRALLRRGLVTRFTIAGHRYITPAGVAAVGLSSSWERMYRNAWEEALAYHALREVILDARPDLTDDPRNAWTWMRSLGDDLIAQLAQLRGGIAFRHARLYFTAEGEKLIRAQARAALLNQTVRYEVRSPVLPAGIAMLLNPDQVLHRLRELVVEVESRTARPAALQEMAQLFDQLDREMSTFGGARPGPWKDPQ